MTDRELAARIAAAAGRKAGYKQLIRELSLGGGRERRLLLEQLARLTLRDQVLVEVDPPKADGRMSGRIVRILERGNPSVVGTFHYANPGRGHRQNVVIPFDERMTQPIVIPPGAEIPPDAIPCHP